MTMNEMITIPKARYEALLAAEEHLSDIAAYDEAMKALEAGEEELIPAEFVNRIVDGENPVRVYREFRNLTAAGAARQAGIHRAQWHDIETGKKRGSIDTLKAIAAALRIDIGMIV